MSNDYLDSLDKEALVNHVRDLERRMRSVERRFVKFNRLDEVLTDLGVQMQGEFRSGNGVEPGSGFTGGRFGYPGFTYGGVEYFFVGVENDVLMIGLEIATGKLLFGGGNGWFDNTGMKIRVNTDNSENGTKGIEFVDENGVVLFGIYNGDFGVTGSNFYGLKITSPDGKAYKFHDDTGDDDRVARIGDIPVLSDLGDIGVDSVNFGNTGAGKGGNQTIANNTVYSFTPKTARGVMILRSSGARSDIFGMVTYAAVAGTAYCYSWGNIGSNTNVTTGALTGSSGTVGKVTISAHTDGKIYVENRQGNGLVFAWQIVAGE